VVAPARATSGSSILVKDDAALHVRQHRVEGFLQGAGAAFHLRQQQPASHGGEDGDGEVVRIGDALSPVAIEPGTGG
jgi:hypothetical protein